VIRAAVLTVALATVWLAAGTARWAGPVVGWGDNSEGRATPPAAVDGIACTASAVSAGANHS
jgi:hypothetical protein